MNMYILSNWISQTGNVSTSFSLYVGYLCLTFWKVITGIQVSCLKSVLRRKNTPSRNNQNLPLANQVILRQERTLGVSTALRRRGHQGPAVRGSGLTEAPLCSHLDMKIAR